MNWANQKQNKKKMTRNPPIYLRRAVRSNGRVKRKQQHRLKKKNLSILHKKLPHEFSLIQLQDKRYTII